MPDIAQALEIPLGTVYSECGPPASRSMPQWRVTLQEVEGEVIGDQSQSRGTRSR